MTKKWRKRFAEKESNYQTKKRKSSLEQSDTFDSVIRTNTDNDTRKKTKKRQIRKRKRRALLSKPEDKIGS